MMQIDTDAPVISKELSQAELQKIWDTSLLTCWKADSSGWSIVTGFLKGIESDLAGKFEGGNKLTDADFAEVKNSLVSYQLSRCLDWGTDGQLEFRGSKTARAFVAEHCERLNICLWSGKHTNEALLQSIDNFKWLRKGRKVHRALNTKHKRIQRAKVDIAIKARSLSKKHDWETVK
jgi:hypothetical protein